MQVYDAVCQGNLLRLRRLHDEIVIMEGEQLASTFTAECVYACIFNTEMRYRHGENAVLEALEMILENLEDTLRTDTSGYIRLHDQDGGHVTPEIAQMLLSHGANPDAVNGEGQTALFHCTLAVARVLVENNANVNVRDNMGQTALFHCTPAFARVLIENNADVNVRDRKGQTAMFSSGPEVTRILILRGADVNARDTKLQTPIFNAMPYMVTILLEHRADVDAKDQNGETPLFAAIKDEDYEKAQLLYDNNANLYQVSNRTNQTAVGYAASLARNPLREILLQERRARRSEAFALSGVPRPGKHSKANVLSDDLVKVIAMFERNL